MKKEKLTTEIKPYPESWKVIGVFKKKGSPFTKVLASERGEKWLVEVLTYKTKTGEIVHNSLITQNDVANWIERFERILKFKKV
jgi:hypothetical protein